MTFDVWHFHRGGARLDELAGEDLALVRCIQINDAAAEATADAMTESISARLFPGDGVIAFESLLPRLLAHAATDVVSVEVFSTELRRKPVPAVAKLAADATHHVLAASSQEDQ